MTKNLILAGAIALMSAIPAAAELMKVPSQKPVAETMDALQAAVEGAGATVFARVDHAAGAQKVGLELAGAQLLVFGNPKLGTPAMQADIRAGLYLPLKVLAYEDTEGQVWLSYEDPADMFSGLDIPADAGFIAKMQGALGKLTAAASQ
ncbi:camphor resistance protein CrcB [Rhodobacteraceae bacterium (ex Bugula neritina AB1)]|nr:camphor resistance protein CrcB [Rhodobacteraceae bacterium (ex Bugula neritina AB1)]